MYLLAVDLVVKKSVFVKEKTKSMQQLSIIYVSISKSEKTHIISILHIISVQVNKINSFSGFFYENSTVFFS